MTTDPLAPIAADEPAEHGASWLLDLVAAVDHLRRGHRPGFTVWDALEEALRWHTTEPDTDEPDWDDPDPLRRVLAGLLDRPGAAAVELQTALRRWVLAMADRCNDGHHWPHPTPGRSFPPPHVTTALLQVADDDDPAWPRVTTRKPPGIGR